MWIHDMLTKKTRKIEGEYGIFYRELIDDEAELFQYFRMSIGQ